MAMTFGDHTLLLMIEDDFEELKFAIFIPLAVDE